MGLSLTELAMRVLICLLLFVTCGKGQVSDSDKTLIINKHNELRGGVDPPATNMQKVIWDENLAITAQEWSDTCPEDHDPQSNRLPPEGYTFMQVGQNMAFGENMNWEVAIQLWYDEKNNFEFGVGRVDPSETDVLHYTQVTQAKVARIGCGYTLCPDKPEKFKKVFNCNYIETNLSGTNPYVKGTAAAECGTKDGNLCDCNGKLCRNGGTLDLSTCTCLCAGNDQGDVFTGPECEVLSCPNYPDPEWPCTTYACSIWSGPRCPYKCNYCSTPCTKKCENGNMKDYQSASCYCKCNPGYVGDQCETFNCPAADPSYCAYYPTCSDSIKPYCPYKCGLCTSGCSKDCKNGGVLVDPTSPNCYCNCHTTFTGAECESCKPGAADPFSACAAYGATICNYVNYKYGYCPVYCGLCD